jgi:single-stranded-DNA-specific exonuclease
MKITNRDVPPRAVWALEQAGVHPLLARLYAARGMATADELDDSLARLLPPTTLKNADAAAVLMANALENNLRICVVADYDCDGATACAVALRGLRMLQAALATHQQQPAKPGLISYLVPDRVADGYGLTPGYRAAGCRQWCSGAGHGRQRDCQHRRCGSRTCLRACKCW